MSYTYWQEVLEALAAHGLRPTPSTSPALLREQINDLYLFEIRRLKARLLRREFPKAAYAGHVVDLRKRYVLLSIPVGQWTT